MSNIISANTLFHFTPTKENLLSILNGGFYVRYSLEIFDNLVDTSNTELVIPMTCFCDIPLSQIRNHTDTYGCYSIGLNKSWGVQKSISPVHYAYPNSSTSETLKSVIHNLSNFFEIDKSKLDKSSFDIDKISDKTWVDLLPYNLERVERIEEIKNLISHFVRFLKPYEGKLYRNEQYIETPVKFYDEREWRYVPSRELLKLIKVKDSYMSDYFKDVVKRRYINMQIAKHEKLEFESKDIRFIVVKTDNEIPEFLDRLYSIFDKQISSYDLRILGTRIISLEQIVDNI